MIPNRRLDQLEPLVADVLQKVDQLIEGQGQLVELAVRADQNAEVAARGIGKLTVNTQQGFTNVRRDIAQVDLKVDDLRQEINQQFTEVNQRFDQLITLIQERLK